jgi:hypothetical protein
MVRTLLASFALAFMAYWVWTSESLTERQASLMPTLPTFVRDLKPAPNTSALQRWLSKEAGKVGRIGEQPTTTVVRLKKKALSLKPSDLEYLLQTAVNPGAGGDERFLSVYMIGLSEAAAAKKALREIAETPVPPTPNDRAYSDEVVIRAHAMESLVQRQNQQDSVEFLRALLGKTTDASIARHARYLLSKL